MKKKIQKVVAMLPYFEGKILLQLRDPKPEIVFPGHWGFFSGSMEEGETPRIAAFRELFEELHYKPKRLRKVLVGYLPEQQVESHVFCCVLDVPVNSLSLYEGMDFGLFSFEEILTKKIYSSKMNAYYPVIDASFFFNTIREAIKIMEQGKNNQL